MAYSEQTASSPDDVISKIATFAAANGWTIDRNDLVSTNRTLTLRNGTDHVHVYNTDTGNIRLRGSVGYTAGAAPSAQPNVSVEAITNVGVGPYTKLYLFASATPAPHIHAVIELADGIFRFLSFGMVEKLGTWTGGTYVDASYWRVGSVSFSYQWSSVNSALFDSNNSASQGTVSPGAIRCDIPLDSRINAWAVLQNNASYRAYTGLYGATEGNTSGEGFLTSQYYSRNNPPFSGQIALGAISVEVSRIGGFFSMAGVFPNIRYLNMARFNPGQEIAVGTDTWKVFPMLRKGTGVSGNSAPYSNNHGYAFLKTA